MRTIETTVYSFNELSEGEARRKVKGIDNGNSYDVITLTGDWLTSVTDAEQLFTYLEENKLELINYNELARN